MIIQTCFLIQLAPTQPLNLSQHDYIVND